MFDRQVLIQQLRSYQTSFPEEQAFIHSFLELLQHQDCFERTHLPGHITGSSWIVDQPRKHVGFVNAKNLESAFEKTQNLTKDWNEANPCRSVSIGDVLQDPAGRAHMVMPTGFKQIDGSLLPEIKY